MDKLLRYAILTALYLLAGCGILVGYTIQHENVHVEVCKQNGGTASVTFLEPPYLAVTRCNMNSEAMRSENIQAEIVGYNAQVIIATMYICCGLLIVVLAH